MTKEELQRQLEERDDLVQMLTQQLEQAAEQLDRLQRSGGVSGRGPVANSQEFQKQHEVIGRDLAYLVEQWDQSQLAGAVGRIELQLEELRDLVSQVQLPAGDTDGLTMARAWKSAQSSFGGEESHAEEEDTAELTCHGTETSELPSIPDFELNDLPTDSVSSSRTLHSHSSEEIDAAELDLPELPAPVADEETSLAVWQAAVYARDDYIGLIIDQLRQRHQRACMEFPRDWDELIDAPEELCARLQKLEQQMLEQMRLNEVSMSIERARISREKTHLQTARMQLQKEMKKFGMELAFSSQPGMSSTSVEPRDANNTEKQRAQKWLSMLRIKENRQ